MRWPLQPFVCCNMFLIQNGMYSVQFINALLQSSVVYVKDFFVSRIVRNNGIAAHLHLVLLNRSQFV